MAQRLAMLSLLVPEYDAGIAFYVDRMGFDLLEDIDLGGGKRWVRVAPAGAETAGFQLSVWKEKSPRLR